jgi:hypothetical protein
MRFGLWA